MKVGDRVVIKGGLYEGHSGIITVMSDYDIFTDYRVWLENGMSVWFEDYEVGPEPNNNIVTIEDVP